MVCYGHLESENYNTKFAMKKISSYISIITIVIILSSYGNNNTVCTQERYTICKIDSIKNWYIIYANKNDSVFKIVSMKNVENNCDCTISIGKQYDLSLQKCIGNVLSSHGIKLMPMNYLDIQGLQYNSDTDICIEIEKGVLGLYTCRNLVGLCYDE